MKQLPLKECEQNRYWKIKLSRFRQLVGNEGLLYKSFWKIATLLMVFPLFVIAWHYGRRFQSDRYALRDHNIPYDQFTDVYPGCVYSPFAKGYELSLFRECEMEGPVLEIGIGDGYFSSLLFSAKGQKLTYGADLIFETLKSATKYSHCEEHVIMDALELPFPDNSMGTIVMNNLMHHLPNRKAVLQDVHRVLRPGGRFIFIENTAGWGTFTWEQALLRKIRFRRLAERILVFKLKLLAQELLIDEGFYETESKNLGFTILRKVDFASRTTIYLGSIFEFLNLKQGQPTRKEMKTWLRTFGLEAALKDYMKSIIEYCIARDSEAVQKEGFAYQFLVIEKDADGMTDIQGTGKIQYACPKCKTLLSSGTESLRCGQCGAVYPVIEGIPILISYMDKLKGFRDYLERKRHERSEEFIT